MFIPYPKVSKPKYINQCTNITTEQMMIDDFTMISSCYCNMSACLHEPVR